MSVTDGYRRDPRNLGPQTVMRRAPVNLSQADVLQQQAQMTKNEERKRELMYLAALEKKFAQQTAQAQQGVQDATLAGGLKQGDFIYGSPWQSVAKMQRGTMRDQAAQAYNAGLPAGYMGQRKAVGSYFHG